LHGPHGIKLNKGLKGGKGEAKGEARSRSHSGVKAEMSWEICQKVCLIRITMFGGAGMRWSRSTNGWGEGCFLQGCSYSKPRNYRITKSGGTTQGNRRYRFTDTIVVYNGVKLLEKELKARCGQQNPRGMEGEALTMRGGERSRDYSLRRGSKIDKRIDHARILYWGTVGMDCPAKSN